MSVITDIKKVLDSVSSPFFDKPKTIRQYNSQMMDETLFSSLPSKPTASFTAIDGGSSAIYLSTSLAVFFIRVVGVSLKENQSYSFFATIHLHKDEYVISYSSLDSQKIPFLAELPDSVSVDDMLFSRTLDLPIKTLGHFIRRLSELLVGSQSESELVLLDGQLRTHHPFEKKYVEKLAHKTVGVVKTSRLVLESGKSVLYALSQVEQSAPWVVSSLYEPKTSDVPLLCFVKLHPLAKHVFVCETYNTDILSHLVSFSTDNSFLGYPYPLVKADELARISSQETSYIKTRVMQQFDSLSIKQLDQMKMNQDSHELLDSLKF